MGVEHLWDTNIAIYYLQNQLPERAEILIDTILNTNKPAISVITEMEALCWRLATEADLLLIKNFIKDSVSYQLTNDIKIKAIEIRKDHRLKLPDAIIAATAIVHGKTLLTRNISDFSKIKGVNLFNPFESV